MRRWGELKRRWEGEEEMGKGEEEIGRDDQVFDAFYFRITATV